AIVLSKVETGVLEFMHHAHNSFLVIRYVVRRSTGNIPFIYPGIHECELPPRDFQEIVAHIGELIASSEDQSFVVCGIMSEAEQSESSIQRPSMQSSGLSLTMILDRELPVSASWRIKKLPCIKCGWDTQSSVLFLIRVVHRLQWSVP